MSSKSNTPKHDHERTDWDLRFVFWDAVSLVVCVAVFLAVSWWIFLQFRDTAANRRLGTARGQAVAPPEPRIQVSPTADLQEMLKREQAILHTYGWIDRSRGVVRIPIDRAMQLIAERGLPAENTKGGNEK